MNKYIHSVFFLICFISCKTISVNHENQTKTIQNIQLGTIGERKDFVLKEDYNHIALPSYQNLIKIQVNENAFNASTFKVFEKAKENQKNLVVVNYVDSLKAKPKFLKLEISDRLTILNSINSKENEDLFKFLKTKKGSHIITTISIAFKESIIKTINDADEVFLANTGINNYALKLFKNKIEQQTILFSEGVVFGYQSSNVCWKENDQYKLEVVDIVERNDKCPTRTYRSSKRAKKKINYYKF